MDRAISRLLSAAFVAFAFLALGAPAQSDEPVTIRAAWINTPASLIPILFAKEGIAQHQGKTYNFQPVYVQSSPTQITAIAAGDLDIATLNFISIPVAILNAKLTDLRIIADETQAGVDGHATVEYAVLKDSPFKTVEDLKGKTVSTIGIGSGTDIAMRATMSKHGLKYPGDYTIVEARPNAAVPMLIDHKVDMTYNTVPFTYLPDYVANARVLFTMYDGMGGAELSVWLARSDFIAKHRAALVDLMEDMVRSYRWYADPKNHDEAVAILSRTVKQPPEQLTGWAFTKKDFGRNLDGIPDTAMLQRNIDTVQSLGFIKSHVDVASITDLSLVKEADSRLK